MQLFLQRHQTFSDIEPLAQSIVLALQLFEASHTGILRLATWFGWRQPLAALAIERLAPVRNLG